MVESSSHRLPTGIVTDGLYRLHGSRQDCPECPERYDAALAGIAEIKNPDRLLRLTARDATRDELLLCHTAGYIDLVQREVADGRYVLTTGDTELNEHSFAAAVRAAGGALAAVDAVMDGTARNAFCPVRPPGHHAETDRGMGFCIFNNVALAARHAQKRHGIERVLIADWDVHHGNGTQALFYEDPSVFYFSTHQWPSYPGTGMARQTGTGAGRGTTLNCPHAIGAGAAEIVGDFRSKLIPAMTEFRPQLVLVSAGFDAESGDTLGGFALQPRDCVELTRILMRPADEYAGGRLVSVLEGGYRLEGLRQMIQAHVGTLAGTNG